MVDGGAIRDELMVLSVLTPKMGPAKQLTVGFHLDRLALYGSKTQLNRVATYGVMDPGARH